MIRVTLSVLCLAGLATAQSFTFALGSPVAAREPMAKTAVFVFRTQGCADLAAARFAATAEGRVNGERRSVALNVTPMSTPGVYAVYQTWGKEGEWVVTLRGECAGAVAGAIAPVRNGAFSREEAKLYPRAATPAEVDSTLTSFSRGESK